MHPHTHHSVDADVGRQVPISRRRLIGAGAGAAIAAGLLGTAGTSSAAPAPHTATITLGQPFTSEAFAAYMAEWRRQNREIADERERLYSEIEEQLGADGHELMSALDIAYGSSDSMEMDRIKEELCAHLPGLDPAIRLVWGHVLGMDGGCGQVDCGGAGGIR